MTTTSEKLYRKGLKSTDPKEIGLVALSMLKNNRDVYTWHMAITLKQREYYWSQADRELLVNSVNNAK